MTLKKAINILLKILVFPLVLGIILIKYNYHGIVHAVSFMMYGGEWVTYAKEDRTTMLDIYRKLEELEKQGKI